MWVKICGITNAEQAVEIARMGATALGFICVPQSPRYVTPQAIGAIADALGQQLSTPVETVGVFVDATVETLQAAAQQGRLQTLQLHGEEPVELCHQLRSLWPSLRLIKALRIRSRADLDLAVRYAPAVDALLLDAYHPQLLGGTGMTLDWAQLQTFAPGCPWILAGGLSPENITQALQQLSPDGIDLSSSLEHSPGCKDLSRVDALFKALEPLV